MPANSAMNGLERLTDGGIYIITFLGLETGKSHWGLYHHYNIEWVQTKATTRGRYIPRGHKYHIRNIGSDGRFIPDHAPTSGVLSSMYLIGLMLIGIVPMQYKTSLDSEIRSFDHLVGSTPDIRCQNWVLDTVERLIGKGFLRSRYTREQVKNEIQQFIERNWSEAFEASQPRPIDRSLLFDFN